MLMKLTVVLLFLSFSLKAKISLDAQNAHWVNNSQRNEKNQILLKGEIDYQRKRKNWDKKFHLKTKYFQTENDIAVSLPEGYGTYKISNKEFTFGRRVMTPLSSEDDWGLSTIHAQQNIEYLDHQKEGLTGVMAKFKSPHLDISVLASAAHVPELNPITRIKDKRVSSPSPWTLTPPHTAKFNDVDIPIEYELNSIDLGATVFRPTAGLLTDIRYKNFEYTAFGFYKPENTLRFKASGTYDQTTESAQVNVTPFSAQEIVVGNETRFYIDKKWTITNGFSSSNPQPTSVTSVQLDGFVIEPQFVRRDFAWTSVRREFKRGTLGLSALFLTSPAKLTNDVLESKARWHRAVQASGAIGLSREWMIEAELSYDLKHKDLVTRQVLTYAFIKSASLSLGHEMINAKSKESFWSRFASNDRVFVQMGYSF